MLSLQRCLRHLPRSSLASFSRFSSSSTLMKTPLYDEHVKLKGNMVDFAGWALPLKYENTHIESHTHTRTNASLFDVSHMLQIMVEGNDRIPFIERATVAEVNELHKATYSLIPNEKGGIIDDCMLTAYEDHIYLVVNAACAHKDWEHLSTIARDFDVKLRKLSNALIALQGPLSWRILRQFVTADLKEMHFLNSKRITVNGESCIVTRCGYTGEDGFEISVPPRAAAACWDTLLNADRERVWPAGLAVRDSLRLESGLCLYGNDLDDTTTPMEASLLWTISKKRRANGGFVGDKVILDQINSKQCERKRVGITLKVKGIPREGAEILALDGTVIGSLTSATFSPVLKQGIGMAYVATPYAKVKNEVYVRVKNKTFLAEITKLPFLPPNYYQPKAK